ncbi:MAG: aminomethyl-transferring glycine dehydrogenase subunit GcvPA [Desulfurococcales archaeon]|nr:aminomethyl-transferring glycine dehydrogenase subunit GcvPA [Desulfurococcales archaeon]
MRQWIPNSDPGIVKRLLEKIGVDSVEDLYRDIPGVVWFRDKWDSLPVGLGGPISEVEASRHLESLLSRNRVFRSPPPFMGGGVWPHYIPPAVSQVLHKAEILTAYTPYQAEINQGLMQLLFEYQSMIADLVEMEVVNSSMYDWSTALGEAGLMALRVNRGRRRIVVPETMNPRHRSVLENYVEPHGGVVVPVSVDRESGMIDLDSLDEAVSGDTAAVYVEYPSYLGVIDEGVEAIGEIARKHRALYIMGVEPISMALLKPPGRLGADIVVGEGQPLGIGLNYGGPYLGIFAVRWDMRLVRQMPGRIIGLTSTVDGERGFAMILQTREQHIRRAKATSNITTNEALMAIIAASYMALLGGSGLRKLAELIWYRSHYAARKLGGIDGVTSPLLTGEFIMDFTVRLPKPFTKVREGLKERGILAGIPLAGHTKWLGEGDGLLTVTEVHTKSDIDMLVEAIAGLLG